MCVCSGKYDTYLKDGEGKDQKVGSYSDQGSFGELALMYNMPRAATIVAATEGSLWALVHTLPCTLMHVLIADSCMVVTVDCVHVQDRTTFRRIILKNVYNKRKMYEALLESVPMLKELSVCIH